MTRRLACLLGALSLAALPRGGAVAGERQAAPARLCPDDLPEGAHLPPQPGCSGRDRAPRRGRGDGFVDLGNGTSVRIGGRAAAEYGVRR
jgi:hypothetical protein